MAAAASTTIIALGMLLIAPATGAENEGDFLQLSHDGVQFAATSTPTFFGNSNGLVPGESRKETIWVRNGSPDAAHFSLGVRNIGANTEAILPGYLRLQATAQGHGAETAPLPTPGGCTAVFRDWSLAAGDVLPLTVDLGLHVEAPNRTKNQQADFDLIFVLQDSRAKPMVGPCSGNAGSLPVGAAVVSVGIAGGTAGDVTGDDPQQSTRQELPGETWPLPVLHELQSNVEAIVRTPWPWLALVGAVFYALTLIWRRSRTT